MPNLASTGDELVCVGKPANPHGRDEDEEEDP